MRAGTERFKLFDLAEIENLRARSGLRARINQRQHCRDVYRNLTFHGHHLTASMNEISLARAACPKSLGPKRDAFKAMYGA